jgi:hypothetical protein
MSSPRSLRRLAENSCPQVPASALANIASWPRSKDNVSEQKGSDMTARQVFLRETKHDAIKSAIAFAFVGNEHPAARSWALDRWGQAGTPTFVDKAAESSSVMVDLDGSTTSGLIDRALFGAVREQAVLFRLRGARRTGWNVRSILTGGTVASWVQEGKAIPVNKASFDNVGLEPCKVAGITVATDETLQAVPDIEAQLFGDLTRAVVDVLDRDLLDPANAGSAGVTPPSITNGVAPIVATSDPAVDLAALVAAFGGDLLSSYFVMRPETAVALAATGNFPDLGARGGEAIGLPVLTSRNAPIESVILVDPTGFMVAYDEAIQLEASRQGTLQMDDAPTMSSVPPSPTNVVSLWQANSRALRAIANVAWEEARPGGVAMLQGGGSDWLDIAGLS